MIWPDNDQPGFNAAKQIEKELYRSKLSWQEIRTIDPSWLKEKFPKGWDLADKWPESITKNEAFDKTKGFEISLVQDWFENLAKGRNKSFAERQMLSDIAERFLGSKREQIESAIGQALG